MLAINGTNVGSITRSSEKSNTGKNVGAVVGAGAFASALALPILPKGAKIFKDLSNKSYAVVKETKDVNEMFKFMKKGYRQKMVQEGFEELAWKGIKKPAQAIKSFVKDFTGLTSDFLKAPKENIAELFESYAKNGTKVQKFIGNLATSKTGRIAVVGSALALGLGAAVAVGRGIGSLVDKFIDNKKNNQVKMNV